MYIGFMLPGREHHITLQFNGHKETKAEYQRAVLSAASVANGWPHGPMELGFASQLERFSGSGVWYVPVESEHIQEMHERLCEQADFYAVYYAQDFAYVPHVTLAKGGDVPNENPYLHTALTMTRLTVVSREFGTTNLLI